VPLRQLDGDPGVDPGATTAGDEEDVGPGPEVDARIPLVGVTGNRQIRVEADDGHAQHRATIPPDAPPGIAR
jgi:hypothetical protein